MITLMYETPQSHASYTGITSIEITIQDEASLDECLEAYKGFLLACGYCFDPTSSLQIVEDDV